MVLVENGKVLLVRRKFEPHAGMWTLPAGFVEADEDAANCAVREMKEETNLDIEIARLFNVYSAFDDPRTAVVLVLYLGKRVGGELRCGDDACDARFYDLGGASRGDRVPRAPERSGRHPKTVRRGAALKDFPE